MSGLEGIRGIRKTRLLALGIGSLVISLLLGFGLGWLNGMAGTSSQGYTRAWVIKKLKDKPKEVEVVVPDLFIPLKGSERALHLVLSLRIMTRNPEGWRKRNLDRVCRRIGKSLIDLKPRDIIEDKKYIQKLKTRILRELKATEWNGTITQVFIREIFLLS